MLRSNLLPPIDISNLQTHFKLLGTSSLDFAKMQRGTKCLEQQRALTKDWKLLKNNLGKSKEKAISINIFNQSFVIAFVYSLSGLDDSCFFFFFLNYLQKRKKETTQL